MQEILFGEGGVRDFLVLVVGLDKIGDDSPRLPESDVGIRIDDCCGQNKHYQTNCRLKGVGSLGFLL